MLCIFYHNILYFIFYFYLLFFGPHCELCRILDPRSGIEPVPPAVEVWSSNHWTAREVPTAVFLKMKKYCEIHCTYKRVYMCTV